MVVVRCSKSSTACSTVAKMINRAGVFGFGMGVDSFGQVQIMPKKVPAAFAFCDSNQYADDQNAPEYNENNIHTTNVGIQRGSFNFGLIETRFQPAVERVTKC